MSSHSAAVSVVSTKSCRLLVPLVSLQLSDLTLSSSEVLVDERRDALCGLTALETLAELVALCHGCGRTWGSWDQHLRAGLRG